MPSRNYHLAFPLVLGIVGCHAQCETPWYADLDGDGYGDRGTVVKACGRPDTYVPDASDCDDGESAIHPGADDVCNGVDDDCDGEIDHDAIVWYADDDRDGVGDANRSIRSCSAPDGYVDRAGDCDDSDATAYPGAPVELCDGVDQDCDGQIDEGAVGDELWYPDLDQDGYGDPYNGAALCAPPFGWVRDASDCDDGNPYRHPGVLERCNGYDDDCDGRSDDDDHDAPVYGAFPVYADHDNDGWGDGAESEACFVDFGFSTNPGDCDDDDPRINPAAVEVCDGIDDNCDARVDQDDPDLDVTTEVAAWADTDLDGFGDPLIPISTCAIGNGAAANDLDCDDGDPSVTSDVWLPDLDGDGSGAGTPVAGTGCHPPSSGYINVAAPTDCDDDDPTVFPGAVDRCGDGVDQDCTGIDPACGEPIDGLAALEDVGRAYAVGNAAGDGFGVLAAGGDLTGDGRPDALVGAPGVGTVYLYEGSPPEFPSEWPSAVTIVGDPGFGSVVDTVDDVTGDGVRDVAVAGADEVWVYGAPFVTRYSAITVSGAYPSVVGAGTYDGGGTQVVVGDPDVGQVGVIELVPGVQSLAADARMTINVSNGWGGTLACGGAGLLVTSNDSVARYDPQDSGTSTGGGYPIWSGTTGDGFGFAISADGDLDGDGADDVVASAPQDATNGTSAGAVYVFTDVETESAATLTVLGDTAGMAIGQSVKLADLDGDGQDDLVVGASATDFGGVDSGAVYVFHGPASGSVGTITADGILYGPPGSQAGASMAVAELDPDAGADLWVSLPGRGTGTAWLVPTVSP